MRQCKNPLTHLGDCGELLCTRGPQGCICSCLSLSYNFVSRGFLFWLRAYPQETQFQSAMEHAAPLQQLTFQGQVTKPLGPSSNTLWSGHRAVGNLSVSLRPSGGSNMSHHTRKSVNSQVILSLAPGYLKSLWKVEQLQHEGLGITHPPRHRDTVRTLWRRLET